MSIALVQQASNTFTSSSTDAITVTLPSATTAGNCLVALWTMFGDSASPTTVTFTLGGAADHWAQASASLGAAALDSGIHIDPNCAGGQTAIVMTGNGTGAQSAILTVQEWSGIVATTPVDATATPLRQTTSTTTWSVGPTATTAQATEVWFGVVGGYQTSGSESLTDTGTAGWTHNALQSLTSPAGYNVQQLSAYQIASTTGTATYSGTETFKATACVCTLKASSTTNYTASPADSEGLTGSATVTQAQVKSSADNGPLTDAVTASLPHIGSGADNEALTDNVSLYFNGGYVQTPADLEGLTGSVSQVQNQQVVAGGGFVNGLGTEAFGTGPFGSGTEGSTGDALAASDNTTTVFGASRAPADTAGLTDAVVAGYQHVGSGADTAGLTDSVTAAVQLEIRTHTLAVLAIDGRSTATLASDGRSEAVLTPSGPSSATVLISVLN